MVNDENLERLLGYWGQDKNNRPLAAAVLNAYEVRGRAGEGLDFYDGLSPDVKSDPVLQCREGLLALSAGDFPRADRVFQVLLDTDPNHPVILFNAACAKFGLKEIDAALVFLRAVEQEHPEDPRVLAMIARCLYASKGSDAAKSYAKKCLKHTPTNIDEAALLSLCYVDSQDYDAALALAETALKEDPNRFEALVAATTSGLVLRKPEKVRRWADHAVAAYPRVANFWFVKGQLELIDGDFVAAELSLIRLLAIEPSVTGKNLLALVQIRLGKTRDAIENFEQTVREYPKDLESIGGLALAHVHAGDLEQAEKTLEKALRKGADSAAIRLAKGVLMARQGDHKGASDLLAELMNDDLVKESLFYVPGMMRKPAPLEH